MVGYCVHFTDKETKAQMVSNLATVLLLARDS